MISRKLFAEIIKLIESKWKVPADVSLSLADEICWMIESEVSIPQVQKSSQTQSVGWLPPTVQQPAATQHWYWEGWVFTPTARPVWTLWWVRDDKWKITS